jgi:hypothetical protein
MMAIDDLLDRGRDARQRRDEAATRRSAPRDALEGHSAMCLRLEPAVASAYRAFHHP